MRTIPRRHGEPCWQGVVADLLVVVPVPQASLPLVGGIGMSTSNAFIGGISTTGTVDQ
jgi:hypothetical protein